MKTPGRRNPPRHLTKVNAPCFLLLPESSRLEKNAKTKQVRRGNKLEANVGQGKNRVRWIREKIKRAAEVPQDVERETKMVARPARATCLRLRICFCVLFARPKLLLVSRRVGRWSARGRQPPHGPSLTS